MAESKKLVIQHVKNQNNQWIPISSIDNDNNVRLYNKKQLINIGTPIKPVYYKDGQPQEINYTIESNVPANIDWATIGKIEYTLETNDAKDIINLIKDGEEIVSSIGLVPPFRADEQTLHLDDETRILSANLDNIKTSILPSLSISNTNVTYGTIYNAQYGTTKMNVVDSIDVDANNKITNIGIKTIQMPAANVVSSSQAPGDTNTQIWIDTSL